MHSTTSSDDELIYDMLSLMRAYRSGRVDRFEPFDLLPASIDPLTGVESTDITINPTTNLSLRLYRPPSLPATPKPPILVFFHGGGFCLHRASSAPYHHYLNHLTSKARILAASVDYRLAPEHPLPAAYDDAWEAFEWARRGGWGKVILAGDSAGGNMVHNLGMRVGREGGEVEGMVLLNPYFWGKERIGREGEEREGGMLRLKDVEPAWGFLCPGTEGGDDARLNPVAAGAPSLKGMGCRRVLVSGGGKDLLVDRGRAYCEGLRESGWGGEVEWVVEEGEDHGFFLQYPENGRAVAFMEKFVGFCKG